MAAARPTTDPVAARIAPPTRSGKLSTRIMCCWRCPAWLPTFCAQVGGGGPAHVPQLLLLLGSNPVTADRATRPRTAAATPRHALHRTCGDGRRPASGTRAGSTPGTCSPGGGTRSGWCSTAAPAMGAARGVVEVQRAREQPAAEVKRFRSAGAAPSAPSSERRASEQASCS